MSSTRGSGKSSNAGIDGKSLSKEKNVSEVSSHNVDQLCQGVADVSLGSTQDEGEWEVYAKKPKNRAGSGAAKQWGAQSSNSKAWGRSDTVQRLGMHNTGGRGRSSGKTWQTPAPDTKRLATRGNAWPESIGSESSNLTPQPLIPPPLENGWKWQSRAGFSQGKGSERGQGKDEIISKSHISDGNEDKEENINEDDDNSDILGDSDDDFSSDGFDSDSSEKSFETRKKSKLLQKFFEILDTLTVEEISEPARQWHCPACQDGPGSIDWYRGLQPLITHAKTKGSNRVKLHRELAELLDEELRRRGTTVIPAGEAFGKWKGLKDEEKDHEIVWPPMVIIMNSKLDQDENDKWLGMGNQELLECFRSYRPEKARHSYGPQGHRGMSVLIFEPSPIGYLEAERLHEHFAKPEQGTDRNAWDNPRRVLFTQGGKRQLYGFMAVKEDMDVFNQHSQGKTRLKYEMRSYQEMVVKQIKQMSEDNQQLILFKEKAAKEQMKAKTFEESLGIICEQLRKTKEENRIVRQRTQLQHEENKEEMDMQERFFNEQIQFMSASRDAKEENFEKLQQEEREKVKKSNINPSNTEEYERRVAKFIKFQDKEMENFAAERDQVIKVQAEKMAAMRRRHWEEEVELEKEFDGELTRLMDKYSPHCSKNAAANDLQG